MKVRSAFFILSAISVTIVLGTYLAFDLYLSTTGKEIATSWLRSEAIEIQQGNLLTSLSKRQRFIFSSEFINGITLYDMRNQMDYLSLGESFSFKSPSSLKEDKLHLKRVGFLHSQIFYRFKNKDLLLVFEIKSTFLTKLFYICLIALILILITFFITVRKIQKSEEKKRMDIIHKIARQIKHDISSSMSTVVSIAETSKGLNQGDRNSLLSFHSRLQNIIGHLELEKMPSYINLDKEPQESSKNERTPLHFTALIKDIYNESIVRNRSLHLVKWSLDIPFECLNICMNINGAEVSRYIHNLIDNAVESIQERGFIRVSLEKYNNRVFLKISDTGKGIPPDDLKKVGNYGFSRKEGGKGLGVYHARKYIQERGGTLTFESEINKGTCVTIELPCIETPNVYKLEKDLFEHKNYVLIDDDPSVYERLQKTDLWRDGPPCIEYKSSPDEFINRRLYSSRICVNEKKLSDSKVFFFIDYDLKSNLINGIDLIKENHIKNTSILVTNNYSDPSVVEECERSQMKILPKILL